MRLALAAVAASVLSASPAVSPEAAGGTAPWPTQGWAVSTPEEQGVDSARLSALLRHVADEGYPLHSILVVRHGRLVSATYFAPYHREALQIVASCTKSVTGALVGAAIARGAIAGVDRPVLSFFPEVRAGDDPRKARLTVRHLLTMSAGLVWGRGAGELGPGGPLLRMQQSRDWGRFALEQPMEREPGERFEYDSGASQLLSAIVQRATGKPTAQFAREALFGPMGITELRWPTDPAGVAVGGFALALTPESLAKLGYLYLRQGRWEDRQLVSAEWVRDSTRAQIRLEGTAQLKALPGEAYGYQWWIEPWGSFAAHGFGGQYVYVVPGEDLVVVFTAGLREVDLGVPERLVRSFILPALSPRALPAQPAAVAELRALSASLEAPPAEPVAELPALARRLSGRAIRLRDAAGGWRRVTLRFEGKVEARLTLLTDQGESTLPVGLDGVYRRGRLHDGSEVATRGRWVGDDTFELTYQPLLELGPFYVRFNLQGGGLRVAWEYPMQDQSGVLEGAFERP